MDTKEIGAKYATNTAIIPAPAKDTKIVSYFRNELVLSNFAAILGERQAHAYITGVLLAVANNDELQKCSLQSIYTSAIRAATLHISVDPSTKQGYLVPFKGKCTLIVGYKGLQDMAVRTCKYRWINTSKVRKGTIVTEDPISGELVITGGSKVTDPVIGWIAAFQMLPERGQTYGYAKAIYLTVEAIHAHAQKYSKSYGLATSAWKTDTEAMERKTALRILLNTWGYLDPADLQAMEASEEGASMLEAPDLGDDEAEPEPGPQQTPEEINTQLGYDTVASAKRPLPQAHDDHETFLTYATQWITREEAEKILADSNNNAIDAVNFVLRKYGKGKE